MRLGTTSLSNSMGRSRSKTASPYRLSNKTFFSNKSKEKGDPKSNIRIHAFPTTASDEIEPIKRQDLPEPGKYLIRQLGHNSSQRLRDLDAVFRSSSAPPKKRKIKIRPYYNNKDWEEFRLQQPEAVTEKVKMQEKNDKLPKSKFFSLEVINWCRKALEKPKEEDLEIIDHYVSGLTYMSSLPQETRRKLMEGARIVEYQSNEHIFFEGDIPDFFYVIIRGACSVEIKTRTCGGKNYVVTTFYDGAKFGDVAANKESGAAKRTAGIRCAERTFLLRIPLEVFNKVIFFPNQEEFERHMPFVEQTGFFRKFQPFRFVLSIWVRNSKIKTYPHGTFILKQGEKPQGLYIVYKGTCNVIFEKEETRSFIPSSYAKKSLNPPPRNFIGLGIKENSHRGEFKEKLKLNLENFVTFSEQPGSILDQFEDSGNLSELASKSEYISRLYKLKKLKNRRFVNTERLVYLNRREGQVFGAYCLMDDPQYRDQFDEKLTYSVTAASNNVQVMIIPKHLMSYASVEMKEALLEAIKVFDVPNARDSLGDNTRLVSEWHKFKLRNIEETLKDASNQKKKLV